MGKKLCGPDEAVRRILPWIWLAGCFAVYTYFMWVYGEQLLDSDNSTELIYAQLLAEENTLLSNTWWYSTEIRILYFHLVMIPLFKIFSDWHLVRTIGSVVNNLIMLLSYGYFCRGANLRRQTAVSAAFLILPLSEVFFKYTAYGLQYTSYLSIGFVTFGLVLRLCEEPMSRRLWRAGCLLVLSFLNGMAGLREFLVLYLPLLLTAVLCRWFSLTAGHGQTDALRGLTRWSLVSTIAAGAGYLVNIKVLAEQYQFADYSDMMHYVELYFDQLVTALDGIFKNFGYHEGKVLSGYTLLNLLFGILLLVVIYSAAVGVKRLLRGIIDAQTLVSVFFVIATALYLILYLFTTMDCYDRYYIPIAAFAVPTSAYGVRHFLEKHFGRVEDAVRPEPSADSASDIPGKTANLPADRVSAAAAVSPDGTIPDGIPALPQGFAFGPRGGRQIFVRVETLFLLGLMALTTGCAVLSYYNLHSGDEDVTYQHRELAQILLEDGYTVGYSTYASGGILVELTDAAVNMHVMPAADIQSDGNIENLYAFSQRRDVAENDAEGKCFLVFESGQLGSGSLSRYLDEENIIYSSWRIVAYGYESREALLQDLGSYSYTFADGFGYLSDAEDTLDGRILQAGTGVSGGPDMTLYAGTYRVTVEGTDVDLADVSCTCEDRGGTFEIRDIEVSADGTQLTFLVDVPETKENCEIVVSNPSDEQLTLTGVTIERQ